MSKIIKKILYIGDDEVFFQELQQTCSQYINSNYLVDKIDKQINKIDYISKEYPNITICDLSNLEDLGPYLEEIITLKKHPILKKTFFAAIRGSSFTSDELSLLFSSGFQLGHTKGPELKNFLLDCLYIGFGEHTPREKYAKAIIENKDLEIGICSSISWMTEDNFAIETDLSSNEKALKLSLGMFPELASSKHKVKFHYHTYTHYPMTDSFVLEYPFSSPWDKIEVNSIQKETVETWLINKRGENLHNKKIIKVISHDISHLAKILSNVSEKKCILDFQNQIENSHLNDEIDAKQPALIFVDLDDDKINSIALNKLTNSLKETCSESVIIIVTNSPSSSEALQKAFEYKNMISVSSPFDINFFELFLNNFHKTEEDKGSTSKKMFFDESCIHRAIDIKQIIKVTSLTEHEITFISDLELPFFSVLHFNLPIELYVTIVPSHSPLPIEKQGHHYLGFIHSVSEADLKILRKFINQIIYKPIEDFSAENIQHIIDRKENKKEENSLNEEKPEENEIKNTETKVFEREDIKGKSKL